MQTRASISGLALVLATLSGCGGDDDGGGNGGGAYSQFEGIFQVTAHTRNEASCDMPGASVLASPAPFYASVAYSFMSYPSVVLTECGDVAECHTTADEIDASPFPFFFGSFVLDDANGNQVTGTSSSGSSFGQETCTARVSTHTATLAEDGSLTIETRTVIVENVPLDADDFCDLDAAQDMAEGQPCAELEVIEASFVEGL